MVDVVELVPTIDLPASEETGLGLADLDRACRDHGFFLMRNHGMQEAIDEMWRASAEFFRQPALLKRDVMRSEGNALGYYDREMTKRKRDLKEVFDFMLPKAGRNDPNNWPDDADFKSAMLAFHTAATAVAARTLNVIYQALGAPTKGLPKGAPHTSNARLNYYPVADPLNDSERTNVGALGDMALHHHTDPGILTLLCQDLTGGLQAHSHARGWIDVPPAPGTIVVNIGDALQVWSNDNYRAGLHRVVPVKPEGSGRYSTAYFYTPMIDAVLEPLNQLDEGEPHFTSFAWRDYIKGRLDDNYTDRGVDDIQIDRFRVKERATTRSPAGD